MNKAVLLSIKPKYCELIASRKKTVEIRKNRPKIDVPFKCYIYCTAGKEEFWVFDGQSKREEFGNGKVIGEFVCDDIDKIAVFNDILYCVNNTQANKLKQACLTIEEIKEYLGIKNSGYAWHISDLVIYEKPKELSEFEKTCQCSSSRNCKYYSDSGRGKVPPCIERDSFKVTRPPQSWCYVEELEE